MKKYFGLGVTLLLVIGFAIAGCGSGPQASGPGPSYGPGTPLTTPAPTATTPPSTGGNGGSQATIGLAVTDFSEHSITVKANTPITLDDTVKGGGFHILCVGTGNGGQGPSDCAKSGNGPSQLYGNGLTVQTGTKPTITFPNAGTYHVICIVHPGMYIDVTVQ